MGTSCNSNPPSPEEQLILDFFAAVNEKDTDRLLKMFHPDYESEQPCYPTRNFKGGEQVSCIGALDFIYTTQCSLKHLVNLLQFSHIQCSLEADWRKLDQVIQYHEFYSPIRQFCTLVASGLLEALFMLLEAA
jgi:hypothetical protein